VNVVFFLLGDARGVSMFSIDVSEHPVTSSRVFLMTCEVERGVPKRRHGKFRRRDITQRKEYSKREFVVTVMLAPVLNM